MFNRINVFFLCSALLFLLIACETVTYDQHDQFKDDHLSDHKHHVKEEQDAIFQHLAESDSVEIYSCQLTEFSQQCREYPIPADVLFKVADVAKGCESMPHGKFSKTHCPSENRIARCLNIIRNNHDKRSLVYENHYYQTANSKWSLEEVTRVCRDLEGKLSLR